jgi:exodeoxyribonuclease III
MRICTWNINSVRLRQDIVLRFAAEYSPDILCLQEIKCQDAEFPLAAFAALGYQHLHVQGMKSYNGVAILSRLPLADPQIYHRVDRQDCRHIAARIDGTDVEVHTLYIPAGGDVPDPAVNDKFDHKLRFVDELTQWWPQARTAQRRMIVLGDFNIAPLEADVWSHTQLLDVVSHTPIEVEKLNAMQASIDWVDAVRHFIPAPEKLYTWWSYRARDWRLSNRGRRLDHIWVTPPLAPGLRGMQVVMDARDWGKPSDHVPVIVDLDL